MADQLESHRKKAAVRGELPRFIAAGVLGLIVDVCVLYGAIAVGFGWFLGRLVSFVCAVFTTWRFNRRFTFIPSSHVSVWTEWWRYFSAMLLGGAVNYAAYSIVVLVMPTLPFLAIAAVAAGSISGMTVNFIGAKYFVYRRPY